jgi:hypothetical protein
LEIVVLLLQRKLAKATPLIGITEDDVNQANALAEELEAATAEHEQCPDVPRQIDCDRRAAFTLFMNAYPRVRVAIAYLRFAEGDADFIAPALHIRRSALQKDAGRTTCGRFPSNPAQPASPGVDASMTLTGWSDPSMRSPFKA